MSTVPDLLERAPDDSGAVRKARGAYFTPEPITRFIANWAISRPTDAVLEPSAGDAAFLVEAVRRLRDLGESSPVVAGVEIHAHSARVAESRIAAAGGVPELTVGDFFLVDPAQRYDAVIGNPPYIRYQDFTGQARARSRAAALQAGVALSGLASSWAAFVVQSSLFLRTGGRLGLVLPAELLSVNYAAPVRRFLLSRFADVRLVLFTEQVFPEAEADVVLLLASGFDEGSTDSATVYESRDANGVSSLRGGLRFTPADPSDKWTALLVDPEAIEPLHSLLAAGTFTHLQEWGETTLGMVTGSNGYFALSPASAAAHGFTADELLPLSPPGSSHLRGLSLSADLLTKLGDTGRQTRLFRPDAAALSPAAAAYIAAGEAAGVHEGYKCRMRSPWYRVPLVAPADLLLTCMNADTPRLTTNEAGAHHLNSVHGVYLNDALRELGLELLPLAALNSITLLNAEMVGRSYGGGILKLEPREADRWAVPSPATVAARAAELRAIKTQVAKALAIGDLHGAVHLVDKTLLLDSDLTSTADIDSTRAAHAQMTARRMTRGASRRAAPDVT